MARLIRSRHMKRKSTTKMKVGASLVDDDAAPLLILVYDVLVYTVIVANVPSFQNDVFWVNLMDDCNI